MVSFPWPRSQGMLVHWVLCLKQLRDFGVWLRRTSHQMLRCFHLDVVDVFRFFLVWFLWISPTNSQVLRREGTSDPLKDAAAAAQLCADKITALPNDATVPWLPPELHWTSGTQLLLVWGILSFSIPECQVPHNLGGFLAWKKLRLVSIPRISLTQT